jgi:S-adenosylmethionine-diacylglycerol 3-amino-3-carboxypropyl transferase
MSAWRQDLLQDEWQQLLDRAAPNARFLWRSGGTETAFVDPVVVQRDGRPTCVGDLLRYDRELANRLHPLDRVHTYGSFSIADLQA